MTDTTLAGLPPSAPAAARLFYTLLRNLRVGHLQLISPLGDRQLFGDAHSAPGAELRLNDWRACARILSAGDIGFAEAYRAGWVDSPDLAALLRLALQNEDALERALFGGRLSRLWFRIKHWLRPNTREGSARNIHAHYDIGNDFYRLWLDESWTYSSALFGGELSQSLAQAQAAKYQRIIDVLGLTPGQQVLEIGCGWGGFALHAAQQGIHVHGVTISPAQLEIARMRVAAAQLGRQAFLELRDYRDLAGEFDAVVSIEMFEAVGERFWPGYFEVLRRVLKPGGKALVQSITIADDRFERYRSGSDFIQQYIFPGGMLPSPARFAAVARQGGLAVQDEYAFGPDYAETLRRWRSAFEAARPAIQAQGFDDAFIRIWRLYLAYCEAGFDEGRTDVMQFLLARGG
ncbi:cyclopropane-fatty-acyl-phospholipid synthase [Andreprevotia lacus DSM 23236]|uniref:Cyclopropane-fatty-acyl-phospholipid synthase n=1 Tax=Andreprevotia lacus DSM 23236 TaxID=1121001 RepID=A0A1W1XQI0_9NEIS|nr:cyclopropane-fatty-acyl-phospholipid synthase family protein [Andreprevotia lacus]SMC26156.1 cyclopropane-fatty-acyl-phospholipid synthase [Andreprevotia lacus DSM 23236]